MAIGLHLSQRPLSNPIGDEFRKYYAYLFICFDHDWSPGLNVDTK